MRDQFTVLGLLYGDHAVLARRLLSSWSRYIKPRDGVARFCIGLNSVCDETVNLVHEFANGLPDGVSCSTYAADNPGKYPVMRRMLYDTDRPIRTPYVMWFDDDSALAASDVFRRIYPMLGGGVDLLGAHFRFKLRGGQPDYIRSRPWYSGMSVLNGRVESFIAGGWWVARYSILEKWDYPWPELQHRGGDVMLGAMCRQQHYRMAEYREGLLINANLDRQNHKSDRRGRLSVPMLGQLYQPAGFVMDTSFQDFECVVEDLRP